jgi:uncharacterized protein YbjT (DUF2867 family)
MSPQPHTAGHHVAKPARDVGPILVTGATGMVGRHVVRQLFAAGHRPRALVRDPRQARQRLGDHAESVAGTLDRPETIEAALTGIDNVFLLTRQTSRQPDQECAVIRAAARAQVRHVVKLSVFRADEHSPLQVARQHRQTERALEQSGLAYTILRPVFFMQNLFGMLRHGAIRTATGHGRVAMIDARDIASAAVTTLTSDAHESKTYTLTGPEALSFNEVASILAAQTGTQIRHMVVSPIDVRQAVQRMGVEAWFADDMANLHDLLASGYEDIVTDDVHTVTGQPPRPLAQFAHDFAETLTAHSAGDQRG